MDVLIAGFWKVIVFASTPGLSGETPFLPVPASPRTSSCSLKETLWWVAAAHLLGVPGCILQLSVI